MDEDQYRILTRLANAADRLTFWGVFGKLWGIISLIVLILYLTLSISILVTIIAKSPDFFVLLWNAIIYG